MLSAEKEDLERQLIHLADYDPMTGIYSEKAFRALLDSYYQDAVSYGIALFDVDRLSLINEKYGAEIGNRVLQEIAGILKDTMESDRLVAKCAGGMFALVLKGEDLPYLFDLAQAIRFRITDELSLPEETENVTVSGGVYYPDVSETPHREMHGAYLNLQKAKKAGGNCVAAE